MKIIIKRKNPTPSTAKVYPTKWLASAFEGRTDAAEMNCGPRVTADVELQRGERDD